jgi:hypothetical protein
VNSGRPRRNEAIRPLGDLVSLTPGRSGVAHTAVLTTRTRMQIGTPRTPSSDPDRAHLLCRT